MVRILVIQGVAVAEARIRGLPFRFLLVRADAQLSPQPVKVRAATAVLQLAGHLYLLGLGSAAPHWLDPLERTGPRRSPWSLHRMSDLAAPMLAGFLAQRTDP